MLLPYAGAQPQPGQAAGWPRSAALAAQPRSPRPRVLVGCLRLGRPPPWPRCAHSALSRGPPLRPAADCVPSLLRLSPALRKPRDRRATWPAPQPRVFSARRQRAVQVRTLVPDLGLPPYSALVPPPAAAAERWPPHAAAVAAESHRCSPAPCPQSAGAKFRTPRQPRRPRLLRLNPAKAVAAQRPISAGAARALQTGSLTFARSHRAAA
mmetsp:Transcript_103236/g.179106  ORF Transcript_103236/g.179106 Transcript_103236/m.179106 type:complete len:210 (-) Transcript_103236:138-767(-)